MTIKELKKRLENIPDDMVVMATFDDECYELQEDEITGITEVSFDSVSDSWWRGEKGPISKEVFLFEIGV